MEEHSHEEKKPLTKNKKRKLKKAKRKAVLKQEGKFKKSKKDSKIPVEFTYDTSMGSSPEKEVNSDKILADPKYEEFLNFLEKSREISDLTKEQELKQFFEKILSFMKREDEGTTISTPLEEEIKLMKTRIIETETACVKIFKLLDKKKMPKDIMKSLLLIKTKLSTHEYHEAEQTYFALTIGNSTWGVASQSSIDSDEKRQILQAVKRMMTFWIEKMFPLFTRC